jgi:hypothetical protein
MMEGDMVDLLSRRMLVHGLDKNKIAHVDPATLESLQKLSASCENREECELGLADDFADVAWDAYCPNATALKAFGGLQWFRLVAGSA